MALRWAFALTWLGIVLVMLAPFAGRLLFPPLPLAPPAVTPAPSESQVSTQVAQADHPAVVNVHQTVQLTLPADWQATSANADQLAQMLTQVAQQTPQLAKAAHRWQAGLAADAAVTVAMPRNLPGSADQPMLTVFAVKRNGLTLERYLEQATFLMKSHGVPIISTQVETTWRADRLPSAVLRYLLPAKNGVAHQGLQLITMDAGAEHLIVFTLTTPAAQYEALAPVVGQIVQNARF
jgi:hypothetical protein